VQSLEAGELPTGQSAASPGGSSVNVVTTKFGVVTCTTGTLLSVLEAAVPELFWIGSLPPHASAVFDTEAAELYGTLTVRVIVELLPPVIGVVELQPTVPVPVPVHVHALPVDVYEASV
jgi:hypothetical protein